MHLFKSTERQLAMLRLPFAPKANKRSFGSNKYNPIYLNSNKEPTGKNRLFSSRFYSASNSIRIRKVDSRALTAPATKDLPLINPNKPNPEDLKDQLIEPIAPVTLPRFPKSANTLPSVTKILSATMPAASQFILDRWKEAMIRKLGADGFTKYQQETFERGRILHSLVASYLMGQGAPGQITKEIVAKLWQSIEGVVKEDISNVRLIEHVVTHSDMKYRGIVDCVACYKDELCVIDFKTAEKPKKTVESLYDNPLQVTAYCGAINNDKSIPSHVIDRNICAGLVIVAYIDGSAASVYHLGREKMINDYWQQWTARLNQYIGMEAFNHSRVDQKFQT